MPESTDGREERASKSSPGGTGQKDIVAGQRATLSMIQALSPHRDLGVVFADDFNEKRKKWTPQISRVVTARGMLLTEVVLESDDDWPRVKATGDRLDDALNALGLPYSKFFSGNRSVHFHLFWNEASLGLSDEELSTLKDEKVDVHLIARREIRDHVCEKAGLSREEAGLDDRVIEWSSLPKRDKGRLVDANPHLIRVCGCPRGDGLYKTLLPGPIPDSKPTRMPLLFPAEVQAFDLPPELRERIVKRIEEERERRRRFACPEFSSLDDAVQGGEVVCGVRAARGMPTGGRNNAAVTLARQWCRAGVPLEEAEARMDAYTQACENGDDELGRQNLVTLRYAYEHDDRWWRCLTASGVEGLGANKLGETLCTAEDKAKCWYWRQAMEGGGDVDRPPMAKAFASLTAKDVGERVLVRVQIVGQKDMKALPASVGLTCECSRKVGVELARAPEVLLAEAMDLSKLLPSLIRRRCGSPCPDHGSHLVKSDESIDYAIVYCRDVFEGKGRFTTRMASIREAYLVGTTIPQGNRLELKGTVAVNPKTRDITVVATEAKPLRDDFEGFRPTEEQKAAFIEFFQKRNDTHLQIAPHIVGARRELAKKWVVLCHHSVRDMRNVHGLLRRGYLLILLFGDPRVGKSDMAQEGTGGPRSKAAFQLGDLVIAETSGRTGLLYTIDADRRAVYWGALAQNDSGFVALDGLQKFTTFEMGELRETLVSGLIKVERSQKAEALARTRLIACMNPHKRLSNYLFTCLAVLDSNPFSDPVDVTRWDIAVPFAEEDVPYRNIVSSVPADKPMDDEIYQAHVMWAWSRRPDDIVYGGGVKEEIIKRSQELHSAYSVTALPIVNNENMENLTRVAVAFAVLRHSTDEAHEKVIVTLEHVQEAYELFRDTYEALQLGPLKAYEDGETNILDHEFVQMVARLAEDDFSILEAIKTGSRTSKELADILGKAEESVRRTNYGTLERLGLIETSAAGCRLSGKGQLFVKALWRRCDDVSQKLTAASQAVSPAVTASQAGTQAKLDAPEVEPRCSDETLRLIKKNMDAAFGPGWKAAKLEEVGKHLKHLFDGDSDRTVAAFKQACEQRWLPYRVLADGTVRNA